MADLYAAAELAVVGTIQGTAANGIDLRLRVARVIKGRATSVVVLRGQRPVGTEYNGFTFTSQQEIFVLLMHGPGDVYDSVEPYNSACYATYFVKAGIVTLIEHDLRGAINEVPVRVPRLRRYLAVKGK